MQSISLRNYRKRGSRFIAGDLVVGGLMASCLILPISSINARALAVDTPAEPSSTKDSHGYIKQTPLTDTASSKETKEKQGFKIEERLDPVLKADLTLLNSLGQAGWQTQSGTYFRKVNDKLVAADGKISEEISGKPVSVLLEYGLVHAVSRKFTHAQHVCTAVLFRFDSPNGAHGAYSTMREGSSTVVVRGQGSSEDQNSISFFSGNCLIFLASNSEDGEDSKILLTSLADRLARQLPAEPGSYSLISALPHFEKLNGSEKLFMGPKSAIHYANFPFIDELQLDKARGAAYADYQYSRPMAERLKLLIAEYASPELAQQAFNSYTNNLNNYSRKTIEKTDSELICKLSDSYLMCGMNGARVFVIAGSRKANSPKVLARELMR